MASQEAQSRPAIDEGKNVIRALVPKAGPAVGVDVIHHEGDVFLCVRSHVLSLWDEHTDKFVVPFRRTFLVWR